MRILLPVSYTHLEVADISLFRVNIAAGMQALDPVCAVAELVHDRLAYARHDRHEMCIRDRAYFVKLPVAEIEVQLFAFRFAL